MRRGILLVSALACLLTPGASHALSCIGTPVPIVLAANCAEGVCRDAMAMRQQVYRNFMCVNDTRTVVVGLYENWLPFPEIAARLGRNVTSGVYEIRTNERCLDEMAREGTGRRWTDARAGECRLQTSVRRISEDHGTEAFDRLRSDWRAKEFAELVTALPKIAIASIPAKTLVLATTIPAIILPWYLASRVRWRPGRTTKAFLAVTAGQLIICFAAWMALLFSSDPYNRGGEAFWLLLFCLLALAAAIALQIVFLIARWGFAWLVKPQLQPQSSGRQIEAVRPIRRD